MLVTVFSCILWVGFLSLVADLKTRWNDLSGWKLPQYRGLNCCGWRSTARNRLPHFPAFQWSYYASSTVNIFLLGGHISWQSLIPPPGGCSRWESPFFVPCPRCLSTRVKGFAQPEHICQLPLQPPGSQSELPGSASKKLNLSCFASFGNISLHLKDWIIPSLAPQKAGCLRDPGKQGTYVLLQHVGYYLETADGHFCCLCKAPSIFQGASS